MYDNLTRTELEFAYREAEKRIADLEKACDETQELLDKQIEATYKLVEENAELKKENTELKEELKKWKDEWQEQVQKAIDEGYARTLQTIQLSKAKDIIKNLMVYVPVDLKEYEEAKQFISEVEE